MPIINQMIMISDARAWTTIVQLALLQNHPMKVLLLLQQHVFKSSHSTTNFEMHSALKQVFLPKLFIVSGRMLRETNRSKSLVKKYKDTSIILLPSITSNSNFTFTLHILLDFQDHPYCYEHCWLHHPLLQTRLPD